MPCNRVSPVLAPRLLKWRGCFFFKPPTHESFEPVLARLLRLETAGCLRVSPTVPDSDLNPSRLRSRVDMVIRCDAANASFRGLDDYALERNVVRYKAIVVTFRISFTVSLTSSHAKNASELYSLRPMRTQASFLISRHPVCKTR